MNNEIKLNKISQVMPENGWLDGIKILIEQNKLDGVTCNVYSIRDRQSKDSSKCGCNRLIRNHSFTDSKQPLADGTEWNTFNNTASVPINTYGLLYDRLRFIRCATGSVDFSALYTLITNDCNQTPRLILSCYGGAKYFTMNKRLENEFLKGIAEAAVTPGTWLLTTGLNSGVSKLIGEGIARANLVRDNPKKTTVIGLTKWGTITEETRAKLKESSREQIPLPRQLTTAALTKQDLDFTDSDIESLELNHTHLILLDNGRNSGYLTDNERNDFVSEIKENAKCHAVTLIVEGGIHTCEVIYNDLYKQRPVIIIKGSGRMADVIGNLMSSSPGSPSEEQILNQLNTAFRKWCQSTNEQKQTEKRKIVKQISSILDAKYRQYLKIYHLDSKISLTETIFSSMSEETEQSLGETNAEVEDDKERERETNLLKLAIEWNCLKNVKDILEDKQHQHGIKDRKLYSQLFEQSLLKNRPLFIDYILRLNFDPLETYEYIELKQSSVEEKREANKILKQYRMPNQNDILIPLIQAVNTTNENGGQRASVKLQLENQQDSNAFRAIYAQLFILRLYKQSLEADSRNTVNIPTTINELDEEYSNWIGPYMCSVFGLKTTYERFRNDLNFYTSKLNGKKATVTPIDNPPEPTPSLVDSLGINIEKCSLNVQYDRDEMLRDVFLWCIFMQYTDMAKVLLIHLQSTRISASLIASTILKNQSNNCTNNDDKHTMRQHAEEFELYAVQCIDLCYKQIEKQACELLIREIPLFGNITCMQVAIAAQCKSFIRTNCFNQVLNRVWYYKLDHSNRYFSAKPKIFIAIITLGLAAPLLIDYRFKEKQYNKDNLKLQSNEKIRRGINYYTNYKPNEPITSNTYFKQVKHFHQCPMIKMFYSFFLYVWLLLVFSYMMLYHFDSLDQSPHLHWTEIYVIITVSTMLIENVCQFIFEYHTQMLERWHRSGSSLTNSIYIVPYFLFYLALLLQLRFGSNPAVLTTARIIMAFDLELWFLLSLKFVSAVKLLGPKIFMMRNMIRDLSGFLYVIFVCIAAYGIVSRSMFMYKQVKFTGKGIFENIFYPSYWFLFGIVDNEKAQLDDIINGTDSDTNSATDYVAGATAVQVLLALQMLFMNILLLNLLIAVFSSTINKAAENTEYFWQYQRYTFIREYFEKPVFSYPPFTVFTYCFLLIMYVCKKRSQMKIFKMISRSETVDDKKWNDFENACTYNYARAAIESTTPNTLTTNVQKDIEKLKMDRDRMQMTMNKIRDQTQELMVGMEWIVQALDRVKMSSSRHPRPKFATTNQ